MIYFFENASHKVYAVETQKELTSEDIAKLNWLFGKAHPVDAATIPDFFIGPRAAMVTPWSTNAVEITQNMAIEGITRIEEFDKVGEDFEDFDPMISQKYTALTQDIFTIHIAPQDIL